ncbi:hypothetical protein ACFX2J_046109 [Malus domestica]
MTVHAAQEADTASTSPENSKLSTIPAKLFRRRLKGCRSCPTIFRPRLATTKDLEFETYNQDTSASASLSPLGPSHIYPGVQGILGSGVSGKENEGFGTTN